MQTLISPEPRYALTPERLPVANSSSEAGITLAIPAETDVASRTLSTLAAAAREAIPATWRLSWVDQDD